MHCMPPAGEMVGVTIQFCPRDGKAYEAVIPLYLAGEREQGPYMTLEVAGQGQHPRLTFDVREVLLPPVGARGGRVSGSMSGGSAGLTLFEQC